MKESIIQVRLDHAKHIAVKVEASMTGRSMNGYLNDLIDKDLKASRVNMNDVEMAIEIVSPGKWTEPKDKPTVIKTPKQAKKAVKDISSTSCKHGAAVGFCKHGCK